MPSVVKKIKHNLYLLVVGLPLAILLKLLHTYGVNLPFADHWALVPLFMKLDQGILGFSDLWVQHNEHRIVFPKIVSLVLARLTNWHIPAEMAFSVVVGTIGIILLVLMLRNSLKNRRHLVIAALVISFWFFSPIQWQNWLWGWQIEWFMCITSVLAGIYLLEKYVAGKNAKFLWGAIGFATIATYSLGSGMFFWIAGLLLLSSYFLLKAIPKKPLVIWAGVGALEVLAYYVNYHKPPDSPSPTLLFSDIWGFIEFFITTLGRPVTNHSAAAFVFGLVILSTLISLATVTFIFRNKIKWAPLIKWYAIIFYSLTALLSTSAARLGLGLAGAMGSRYTAFSLLIIIGIIGSILTLSDSIKLRAPTKTMVLSMIVIFSVPLIVQSYAVGVQEMKEQSKLFKDIKLCTSIDYPTDHCLRATFPPSADAVRQWLEYLKDKNYAGY